MTFRKASLAVLLTFSLTACSGLDALLDEAVAWVENVREDNTFSAVDADTAKPYIEPDEADEAYEELPDSVIEDGNQDAFVNSIKTVLFPVDQDDPKIRGLVVGKIEVYNQRLYLEFKPNNAFMALQPTGTANEFEADIDFSETGDELIITVNAATRQATILTKEPGYDAHLVLAASPRRVIGVDTSSNGDVDWYLYSDDQRNGGRAQGRP